MRSNVASTHFFFLSRSGTALLYTLCVSARANYFFLVRVHIFFRVCNVLLYMLVCNNVLRKFTPAMLRIAPPPLGRPVGVHRGFQGFSGNSGKFWKFSEISKKVEKSRKKGASSSSWKGVFFTFFHFFFGNFRKFYVFFEKSGFFPPKPPV